MAKRSDNLMITALYERLSKDDDNQGESNSITNQKSFLEDYANRNGFLNIKHYTDDGYSGKNFNRPAVQQMLEDVENGNVGTVIVKDMSRFGRNYLEVGFYTEMAFPKKNVRFIAINNNVDSQKPAENDFTPFLNIMNEWYVKDTSNKIKAIFNARMKDGKRCSGSIPYGYNRRPDDKQTLYVDPVASQVVRHIFELADEGHGPTAIARILTDEHVMTPSTYTFRYHPEQSNHRPSGDSYAWNTSTVAEILARQEYLGHTVLKKSVSINFKTDTRRASTEDEILIFPNTHEPIISQELWDQVQKKRKRFVRSVPVGTYSKQGKYAGLLFCAECGSKLVPEKYADKKGNSHITYRCSKYKGKNGPCTMHGISDVRLDEAVSKVLSVLLPTVINDEEAFALQLQGQWQLANNEIPKKERAELNSAQIRYQELDGLIRSLYENYNNGMLPERQYKSLMLQYDNEQADFEKKIKELEKNLAERKEKKLDISRFLELIHMVKDANDISRELIHELIDRIVVHEKTDNTRKTKKLDIYYNFIGRFDVQPSPAEIKAEIKKEEKKTNEKKQKELEQSRRRQAESRKKKREVRLAQNEGHLHPKKTCPCCGKEFWPNTAPQIYCSKECHAKYANKKRSEQRMLGKEGHRFQKKICKICGKEFWPSNGQEEMCSPECKKKNAKEYRKRYYQKVYSDVCKEARKTKQAAILEQNDGHPYPQKRCPACNELFWPTRPSQKYCCKTCSSRGWQSERKGLDPGIREGHKFYKKICVVCGKEFWPTGASEICCSDECRKERRTFMLRQNYRVYQEKKYASNEGHMYLQRVCPTCGKPYWPIVPTQICCSNECYKGYRFFTRTGEVMTDKEGHKYVKRTCIVCGKEFWPDGPNTKTCSEECRKERNRQQGQAFRERRKKTLL